MYFLFYLFIFCQVGLNLIDKVGVSYFHVVKYRFKIFGIKDFWDVKATVVPFEIGWMAPADTKNDMRVCLNECMCLLSWIK